MSSRVENTAVAGVGPTAAVGRLCPKLAVDQFLPGNFLTLQLWSPEKDASCFCQASGPYQSSVQWILDTGRRVTRPSDWHGWGETWRGGGWGGCNQSGWGPAPEWQWGSSIRGCSQPRHNIVRRADQSRPRPAYSRLNPTQPCATQSQIILSYSPVSYSHILELSCILSMYQPNYLSSLHRTVECESSNNRLSPLRLLHQDLIVGSSTSNTV